VTLGQTIRRAREERDLSIRELARLVGIFAASLCRIENDEHPPALDLIAKFAKVLDLDATELRGLAGRLTDEEIGYLKRNPRAVKLLGAMMAARFGVEETERLIAEVKKRKRR